MIVGYINLIVFVALIYFFSRKKMRSFFAGQREDLEKSMKTAAQNLEKIEAEYLEIKSKVDDLDRIVGEIRDNTTYDIDKESRKIRAEADAFIEKLKKDAEMRMDQSYEKAKKQIESELLEIALAKAEQRLESRLENEDQAWTSQMLQSEAQNVGTKNYAS